MAVKLGSTDINKIYLGSTEIKKAYLGSTLIYDKTVAASYLLDTYTGAAAAYSLRQLKTGVTNVVRVRRVSDDAEADFTPTQITDGTLTTWTGANDGYIATFYDQSGNGNNATQSVTTAQPQIVSSGSLITRSGFPCLRGLGDRWLVKTTDTTDSFTSASTFCVASIAEDNPTTRYLYSDNFSTANEWQGRKSNAPNAVFFAAQSNATFYAGKLSARLTQDTLFLADAYFDGSAVTNYLDNTLSTGVSGNTTNSSTSALMARRDSGTEPWYGDFLEIIHFTTNQSSNRSGIVTEINAHYGIY